MSSLSIILLGTGSPMPDPGRSQPSQVVQVGDEPILVDCGEGTMTRLLQAGIDPARVSRLWFTHLHRDHALGYGHFAFGGWTMGRPALAVWGPPGTARLTRALFADLFRADVEYVKELGRPGAGIEDIEVREIGDGYVHEGRTFRMEAAAVQHPIATLAFRIEAFGKVVVISGDTAYCDAMARLARGADVLVQDACVAPTPRYRSPEGQRVWQKLVGHHCTPAQAGRLAREAGVRTLVLTHLLPGSDPAQMRRECEAEFAGRVIVGEDLMTIPC